MEMSQSGESLILSFSVGEEKRIWAFMPFRFSEGFILHPITEGAPTFEVSSCYDKVFMSSLRLSFTDETQQAICKFFKEVWDKRYDKCTLE